MTVSSRLRVGALGGALALAVGLAAPAAAYAADLDETPITLDRGHVDAFSLEADGDALVLALKEDVTGRGVLRSPDATTLQVKSDAYSANVGDTAIPGDAPDSFYSLPAGQDTNLNLVWPGWDSLGLNGTAFADESGAADVDITVSDVTGPGEAYLYQMGFSGPTSVFTDGGFDLGGTIHQDSTAHAHAAWAFTEPGTYTFTAQATAERVDGGGTVTSEEANYTFEVLPAPETVEVAGTENPVEAGDDITLTAAQGPDGAAFTKPGWAWETRDSGTAEWQTVAGATSETLTVAAVDGAQYRAVLSGGKDYQGQPDRAQAQPIEIVSDPVTVEATDDGDPAQTTVTIEGLQDHYHTGDIASLTAVQQPDSGEDHWHWFIQREGDDDFGVIADALTDSLEHTVAEGDHGAKIKAVLYDHDHHAIAESDPVTIQVDDHGHEHPETDLTIEGLGHHYHQGGAIELNAVADPAVDDASYEWFLQRSDQDAPVRVEGQSTAAFSITAEQALNGARVSANLLDGDGEVVASADPVTIEVDDHGAAPHQQVSIEGIAGHYHTGDTAVLTASVDPASVLDRFVWEIQRTGSDEWVAAEGENGSSYSFEVTEELEGAQVRAVLTYDTGDRYVASEPVTIEIDDHHEHPEPDTTVTIEGLADEYEVGDVAKLDAVQDPDTGEDHWHWFIQRESSDEFEVISGALSSTLEYTIAEGDDGAEIKAVLYDHDHHAIAESEPVSLNVSAGSDENPGDGENPGDEDNGNGDGGTGTDDSGNGGADRNGADSTGGKGGDGLAATGAELGGMIAGAATLLLLAGAVTAVAARRRSQAEIAE
ncbi:choice-of-anchor M domain-containing protein [Leucobacter sp. GX24907]